MSEVDNTPALSPRKLRATDLRLVFYIWPEIECAFTIRGLAQFMSAPTERSWDDAQTPMFQADFANVWSRTCPPDLNPTSHAQCSLPDLNSYAKSYARFNVRRCANRMSENVPDRMSEDMIRRYAR